MASSLFGPLLRGIRGHAPANTGGHVLASRGGPGLSSKAGPVRIKVVGIGGAGGNAVCRMAEHAPAGLEFLAVNTDVQALQRIRETPTLAIGPNTTSGMGSGGNPKIGREALLESRDWMAQLLEGVDMVFVTAGMGGGTGTGAAPVVAEVARKSGALTVGVVTRPFSFEGGKRRDVAEQGIRLLRGKVDTLIVVDNDRLLSSLDGRVSLDRGFRLADEVLRQGVVGVSDIVTTPGLINVDFADVRAVMTGGGMSFMATGEGMGRTAAADAIKAALANPLADAPVEDARGVLLNVKGGKDLSLEEVQELAGLVRRAAHPDAQVVFGVVQEPRWRRRVQVTLVATGLKTFEQGALDLAVAGDDETVVPLDRVRAEKARPAGTRATPKVAPPAPVMRRMV